MGGERVHTVSWFVWSTGRRVHPVSRSDFGAPPPRVKNRFLARHNTSYPVSTHNLSFLSEIREFKCKNKRSDSKSINHFFLERTTPCSPGRGFDSRHNHDSALFFVEWSPPRVTVRLWSTLTPCHGRTSEHPTPCQGLLDTVWTRSPPPPDFS